MLACVLLVAEVIAINDAYKKGERKFKDAEQESRDRFSKLITREEAVQKENEKIFQTAHKAIDIGAGGNSFVYFKTYLPDQVVEVNKVGDDPLYDVKATISSEHPFPDFSKKETQLPEPKQIVLGDYPASTQLIGRFFGNIFIGINKIAPQLYPSCLETGSVHIATSFEARNGTWREDEWLKFVPNAKNKNYRGWEGAIQVWRQKPREEKGKIIFESHDPDFPIKEIDY